jgi:hypothetical protein
MIRCPAIKVDGEQCTRDKLPGKKHCGTHCR